MTLRNCPFCGSEVDWCKCYTEEDRDEYAPNHKGCHRIVCPGCKMQYDNDNNTNPETLEELRAEIAEQWNKRVTD